MSGSKLTLADRKKYEPLVRDYPPISDIQFATLMIWWNQLDSCAVARLNNNLVLSYWFPGNEGVSGLSLVGTNRVDESICTILDHLRERGDPVELVHVPEFVLNHIEYPDLFVSHEERAFDEYIIPISKFYPMSHALSYRRLRVKKFISETSKNRTVLKQLDLADEENRRLLISSGHAWQKRGIVKLNNVAKVETEAMETAIGSAALIGMENICLYIDGELHGFCLYQLPGDRRFVIFNHARVNPAIPRTLDYMIYAIGRWLADQSITFANLESDAGVPFLRMFKLALGPTNYFRKYTIRPAGERR